MNSFMCEKKDQLVYFVEVRTKTSFVNSLLITFLHNLESFVISRKNRKIQSSAICSFLLVDLSVNKINEVENRDNSPWKIFVELCWHVTRQEENLWVGFSGGEYKWKNSTLN